MSRQQQKLRIQKLKQQFLKLANANCLTEKTYALRCTIASFSTLEVSRTEREYLDARWQLLEDYLNCTSASQLAMKMEIAKCSVSFQPIDYVAIALGYCQQIYDSYIFEFPVIIEMVDEYDWFDDAFQNTKFLRMLLKCATQDSIRYLGNRAAPRKLLAHIVKKFPSLKKMNFMFRKTSSGIKPKITDDQFEKWL